MIKNNAEIRDAGNKYFKVLKFNSSSFLNKFIKRATSIVATAKKTNSVIDLFKLA